GQPCPELFERIQRRSQLLDDLRRNDIRLRQVRRGLERLVPQPEDVEARLVPGNQLLVRERAPATLRVGVAPGCRAGLSLAGPVAFDELVEIRSPERIGLEREVLVRPQVVDPQPLRPWPLGARLLVKEEDVRLDTLGVED